MTNNNRYWYQPWKNRIGLSLVWCLDYSEAVEVFLPSSHADFLYPAAKHCGTIAERLKLLLQVSDNVTEKILTLIELLFSHHSFQIHQTLFIIIMILRI